MAAAFSVLGLPAAALVAAALVAAREPFAFAGAPRVLTGALVARGRVCVAVGFPRGAPSVETVSVVGGTRPPVGGPAAWRRLATPVVVAAPAFWASLDTMDWAETPLR